MGKNVISANLITHQCVVLDFCVESTIRCMLDFCDDIYINDGNSTDGTQDILFSLQNEYGKDRVKVFVKDWKHDRKMWAEEKNFILDKVPIDNYVLCIDADEVFHEKDIKKILELVDHNHNAISFDVIHFYGRPTHFISGPNWYKRHTRLWKRNTGIRIIHRDKGCADDVLWPDGFPAHLGRHYVSDVIIYHYGNCRHPMALGMKAKKADDLYKYSKDYEGGKLAEPRSFSYAFDKVGAKEFKGSHPKYIKNWYEKHKDQPTEYIVDGTELKKLWCFEER